jgi:hypothetical protein
MAKSDFTEIRKGVFVLNETISINMRKANAEIFKKKSK